MQDRKLVDERIQLSEWWRKFENVLDEIRYACVPSQPPSRPPLMTTSGCFSPYHNSQLLVFRRRGLLTQCGRALPQPCIRARVLWISIKIEGGEAGEEGSKKNATAFRTFRFPNECSCGTRRDRDEIKEKGFALMTVFVEKPPGVLFSLSLSIYLFRSSLKLNRDDIRDEFRDGVTVMPTLHHPPCYIVSDRFEYVYASIHCPV